MGHQTSDQPTTAKLNPAPGAIIDWVTVSAPSVDVPLHLQKPEPIDLQPLETLPPPETPSPGLNRAH
jgi:hypothetical protein